MASSIRTALGAALTIYGCAHAAHHAHWAYQGAEGPSDWAHLSPDFARCGSGVAQSPIDLDLSAVEPAKGPAVEFHYGPLAGKELNNGHTIQDTLARGDYVEREGKRFELEQFHFHHPSEHTLNGAHFPLEIHLVHRAEGGELLVVGVFVAEGDEHPALRALLDRVPTGSEVRELSLDPMLLLPADRHYATYLGSLTTPPCTEGVRWVVLTTPIASSPELLDAFAAVFPNNARPLMPRNGRAVVAGL